MPYCAKADLVERFGAVELAQLTDESAAHSPVDAEISAACAEASSLIDAYVATRYAVPLSPVPPIVTSWACTIARKILWKGRALPDGAVARAYEETLDRLKDVAKGIARLPDTTGALPGESGGSMHVIAADRVFTDDVLGAMPG